MKFAFDRSQKSSNFLGAQKLKILADASLEFPFNPPAWTTEGRDFMLRAEDGLMIDDSGYLHVPDNPGLGCELDEETLSRYEVNTVFIGNTWRRISNELRLKGDDTASFWFFPWAKLLHKLVPAIRPPANLGSRYQNNSKIRARKAINKTERYR
jgi:hypothetical protein